MADNVPEVRVVNCPLAAETAPATVRPVVLSETHWPLVAVMESVVSAVKAAPVLVSVVKVPPALVSVVKKAVPACRTLVTST